METTRFSITAAAATGRSASRAPTTFQPRRCGFRTSWWQRVRQAVLNGGRTAAGVTEQLFGEQGNDRFYADRPGSNGPAYLDGGEGDDWMYGTSKADTIIANSGIKKIQGEGGDDLLISTARGPGTSAAAKAGTRSHLPPTPRPTGPGRTAA